MERGSLGRVGDHQRKTPEKLHRESRQTGKRGSEACRGNNSARCAVNKNKVEKEGRCRIIELAAKRFAPETLTRKGETFGRKSAGKREGTIRLRRKSAPSKGFFIVRNETFPKRVRFTGGGGAWDRDGEGSGGGGVGTNAGPGQTASLVKKGKKKIKSEKDEILS